MKLSLASLLIVLAGSVSALAQLEPVLSFIEETKLKGGFTSLNGRLYCATEKGGASNFGYLAEFDPATATLTPLVPFAKDCKVKGGLTAVGDQLYFMTEKGGPTGNFSFLARYRPGETAWTVVHEYGSDAKAKSGFVRVGAGELWFATEKGGAGSGSIEKLNLASGTVTTVASLTLADGIKVENLAVSADGQSVFAGAREGGDLAELAGKGAGSLFRVDVATGLLSKLVAFRNADHGAKLRGLTERAGLLWFCLEEGGDLTLNSGKGGGSLMRFDPATGTLTLVHVFDGAGTGVKPKGIVWLDDDLYFVTESGGAGNLGTFGRLRGSTVLEKLADLDATTSTKPDFALSAVGRRLYFTTELGGSGFLGAIVAYTAPGNAAPPRLTIAAHPQGLVLSWPDDAGTWAVESNDHLGGSGWTRETAPAAANATRTEVILPQSASGRFFRLVP